MCIQFKIISKSAHTLTSVSGAMYSPVIFTDTKHGQNYQSMTETLYTGRNIHAIALVKVTVMNMAIAASIQFHRWM